MRIKIIDGLFNLSKVSKIDNSLFNEEFIFISKTDKEISLVHKNDIKIDNIISEEKDYNCFRIDENLDFGLIGIISKIANLLKEHNIPLFVISTYDTDYILVKSEFMAKTKEILKINNYEIK